MRCSFFGKVKVKVTGAKGPNNGPISIKLGGWMQGRVTGSKVKVTGSKVKVKVTRVAGGGAREWCQFDEHLIAVILRSGRNHTLTSKL